MKLLFFLFECHRTSLMKVIIGSGNGLVPSGNKPILDPMLTHIYRHMALPGHNELNLEWLVICIWLKENHTPSPSLTSFSTAVNLDSALLKRWARFWKLQLNIRHQLMQKSHDNVIKWKHFLYYWPFVREIHQSPMNSPHKGQWRGALI